MAIQDIAQAVGLGLLSAYSAWQARKAKKLSEPTGNGFAKRVINTLDRVERKIDDHIMAHADNDVRRK